MFFVCVVLCGSIGSGFLKRNRIICDAVKQYRGKNAAAQWVPLYSGKNRGGSETTGKPCLICDDLPFHQRTASFLMSTCAVRRCYRMRPESGKSKVQFCSGQYRLRQYPPSSVRLRKFRDSSGERTLKDFRLLLNPVPRYFR